MIKEIILSILVGLFIGLALLSLTFLVSVYITYGNTPLSELPAWVIPFFTR